MPPKTAMLGAAVSGRVERLVGHVARKACDRGARLATAESCSGGLLASLLTDVEGCAHVFDRGFVAYTDEAKREMLGVSVDVLASHGSVSAAAALAMAEGAVARSGADLAVAVTGFCGPGAPGEEAGLVYFAVATRQGAVRQLERHFGPIDRGAARRACLETALTLLDEALP